MIEVGGNSFANSIYEAHFQEGVTKIAPDVSVEQRRRFIRSKYEHQDFLKPSLKISSKNVTVQASPPKSSSSNPVQKLECAEGMIEHVKITILQGEVKGIPPLLNTSLNMVLIRN